MTLFSFERCPHEFVLLRRHFEQPGATQPHGIKHPYDFRFKKTEATGRKGCFAERAAKKHTSLFSSHGRNVVSPPFRLIVKKPLFHLFWSL